MCSCGIQLHIVCYKGASNLYVYSLIIFDFKLWYVFRIRAYSSHRFLSFRYSSFSPATELVPQLKIYVFCLFIFLTSKGWSSRRLASKKAREYRKMFTSVRNMKESASKKLLYFYMQLQLITVLSTKQTILF